MTISAQFFVSFVTIHAVLGVILLGASYLIMLERKVSAWVQDRSGPNRTGLSFGILPIGFHFWGLGQPLADGIKLLLKEDWTPPRADWLLFVLAPALVVIPAFLGWAVIPWGGAWDFPGFTLGPLTVEPGLAHVMGAPLNIGVVYILAVGSLAVYGIVVGAYASNNKYSFLGGIRATAQMLSYEIPQSLCVLIMILFVAHVRADYFVAMQANGVWFLFAQPLLAVIFFTCVLAECNRAPFDLAEAEQELIGGYHTEYGSMKWALFFIGEYTHMITGAAFFAVLFLGGWDLPFVREPLVGGLGWVLLKSGVFLAKVTLLLFLMMWIRWTLPRLRFDQLMRLAWRGLIPITLALLLANTLLVFADQATWWAALIANAVVFVLAVVIAPLMPQGAPINRRVPLTGSRFSPAPPRN